MKKTLATGYDLDNLEKIKKIIVSLEKTDDTKVDWENAELQFTLHRVIHNLKNFDKYFKKVPKNEQKWYDAECKCGWYGSSQFCGGGGPIADTGDYSDPTCPVCESAIS